MNNNYKFLIIPHTHWDREWYFTTARSIIYSLRDFKEVIEYLDNNNEFNCFLLDGQTSIIDDYLNAHPEDEEKLREHIKNKRIFTGPWYTQTDQLVISGESITRNLLYGTNRAKELGHCMMVGYMPDSFGQGAQMPQIYNGFDIEKLVFRRGLGDHQMLDSEFYWESEDGSKVFTHNVRDYGNMYNPTHNKKEIKDYFQRMIKELGPISPSKKLFLMNGSDQKPIRKDLPKILDMAREIYPEYEFEITNLENALDQMKESREDFKTFKGEMTVGQHSRVHKSIFSSRADLKIMNNKAENFITNIGEPLATLAYKLGFKYENKIIEQAWKLLCENAAHDSIGMCNSDRTNLDVEFRYKKVVDLIENLNEITMRLIGMSIEEKDIFQFQVYNFLPYLRSGVMELNIFTPSDKFEIEDCEGNKVPYTLIKSEDVTDIVKSATVKEIGLDGLQEAKWNKEDVRMFNTTLLIQAKDIPAVGYKTLYFKKAEETREVINGKETTIENESVKVTLNEDGTCLVENKVNGQSLNGLLVFENSGDDGDTYDYSEPFKDLYLYSTENKPEGICSKVDELRSIISFNTKINIPSTLKDRGENVINDTLPLTVEIEILKDSPLVNFRVRTINKSGEHRLRVLFKTGIEAKESIADQQFGTISRPVILKEAEGWREKGFNEKPRTIEPMQSFVTLRNDERGVALFTDCVREYQIIGERFDTIALTLFRSVPFMGKEELKDRPGRPSGMPWPTPDAELKKELTFNFTLSLYGKDTDITALARTSKEIFTPMSYYQAAHFKNNANYFILSAVERTLEAKYSLLNLNENNTVLSALKKKEDGEGIVIRVFNPDHNSETSEGLTVNFDHKSAKLVKLNEVTELGDLEVKEEIKIEDIKKCQAKTILIK